MENVVNFKKMELMGSTKEEALAKAPFNIMGDATQAYKNWKKTATAKRNTYKNKEGHEKEMPSGFEQTMTYIAQLAGVINPEGFKKMQAASSKFKSFDDVCKALDTILKSKVGTDCFIKLIGRNRDGRVQPAIPNITALNKDGEVFTSDNFISLKEELLGFTEYEETQMKAYKEAKPTTMPVSESVDAPSGHGSEDDDDFSDLL